MNTILKGKKIFLLSLALFFFNCVSVFALDNEFFKKDEPVQVTGDFVNYDRIKEIYTAEGSVIIRQQPLTLKADSVIVDVKQGIANAKGNVILSNEKGDTMNGDMLTIRMEDKTALIISGRIFFKEGNAYISGSVIRKTGEDTYEAENPAFTTCDYEEGKSPAWSFCASSAKLRVEGFLTAWNAFFKVKNVPVFYTPFIAVPVKTKRATGFLFPILGYSRLKGMKIDNAFFWAISESTDATFYLDIETIRGLGQGFEYRYFRTKRSFGELNLYYYREDSIDRVREFRSDVANLSRPMTATLNRWQTRWRHTELLEGGVTLRADINVVSDDEYFIDFAPIGKERAIESIESNLSLNKNWGRYTLSAQLRVFDNLLVKDDTGVFKKLPEVIFTGESQRVFSTPFYLSVNAAFVNFERDVGVQGQRLDGGGRLLLPLKLRGWLEITPGAALRETLYRVEADPLENGVDYRGRFIEEYTTDVTTTFGRFFDSSFLGAEKLRHTIRPKLTYTYVPALKQDFLPSFDSVDRILPANKIRYSLNTIITAKFPQGGQTDVLYMDLAQTYDIRESRGHKEIDPLREMPFSPIEGELRLKPSSWVDLNAKGKYDVYEHWFTSGDGSIVFTDKREDKLSFVYRFVRDETRYLETNLNLNITRRLSFIYAERYSFMEDTAIENSYTLAYKQNCFAVSLGYQEKIEEELFLLNVSLSGIGDVVSVK